MDFELKRLPAADLEHAKKRAEHYRLLNEPRSAESICLDILEVTPENESVIVMLLLARTDQFTRGVGASVEDARELLGKLSDEYERAYYAGVICERWGKARLTRNHPGAGRYVYDWLRDAMEHYERARQLRPEASDPVLRWNSCVRLIRRHPHVEQATEDGFTPLLE
jgi:hypothetical protein